MSLKKKPVTGMRDIFPEEMAVRDYVTRLIKEIYAGFGFSGMETPCVEHLDNLCSKQGGDNEKLIFKILKRGEKLKLETARNEEDVADSGLRYDLTVPLARYYAAHSEELPSPFKALQMGNVWRADRPQRMRFRQFMQCDLDILGDPSNLAEIELILATTTVLGRLGFEKFTIRINDRRILKAMAAYSGFSPEMWDSVFITLDKMDKIGMDGVREELIANGCAAENVEKYIRLFENMTDDIQGLQTCKEMFGEYMEEDAAQWLTTIMTTVEQCRQADFRVCFDPTLVRGMSYYTGTIFEISMDEYGGSVGGGGRYDKMIGKFTGQDVPAVGFSIGFERIIVLLMERGFTIPGSGEKIALLADRKLSDEEVTAIMKEAQQYRASGKQVLVATMKKNRRFQKEQLSRSGYVQIKEYFAK